MQIVTRTEAARATGLSAWELRKGALDGRYPHMRAGNRFMYDLDLLEEAIRDEMQMRMRTCKKNVAEG